MRQNKWAVLSVAIVMALGVAAQAEQIENPTYKSWAKFKPGTSVTMTMSTDTAGQKMKTTTKTTLGEVTDEKLTIEIASSMDMNGQKMDMPAQKVEIKKMVDAPAPGAAPAPGQVDPNATAKTSEESVTVAAGTFKAKLVQSNMNTSGMTVKSKMWMSDDVPGDMVKMESDGEGNGMKSHTSGELTAIEKK